MPEIEQTYWEQKAIELEEAGQPEKARWYRIRRPSAPGATEFGAAKPLIISDSEDARDDIPDVKTKLDEFAGVGEEPLEPVEKQGIIFTRDDKGVITGMGWGTLPGEEEGEKTLAEMDPAERAYFESGKFGEGEVKDEATVALEDLITKWGGELTTLSEELETIKTSAEDASEDLIDAIKKKYDVRRQQMSDLYTRTKESAKVFGIRRGTARYAPEMMKGVLDEVEAKKIQELAVLDAEESTLVAEAKQALNEKKWDMVVEQMDKIEKKRDEKIKKLEELNEVALEANIEREEEAKRQANENTIVKLVQAGITNPLDIHSAFVEAGIDVKAEQIDETLNWLRVEETDKELKTQLKDIYDPETQSMRTYLINTQTGDVIKDIGIAEDPEDKYDRVTLWDSETQTIRMYLIDSSGKKVKDLGPSKEPDVSIDEDSKEKIGMVDTLITMLKDTEEIYDVGTGPGVNNQRLIAESTGLFEQSEDQRRLNSLMTQIKAGALFSIGGKALTDAEIAILSPYLPDISKQESVNITNLEELKKKIQGFYDNYEEEKDFDDLDDENKQ